MICGAVSWLLEHERVEQERVLLDQDADKKLSTTTGGGSDINKKNDDDTPDWVQQHRAISDATIERQERDRKRQELEERVQRIRDKEKKMRESMVRKQKRQAAGAHSIGGYRPHAGQPVKKKVVSLIVLNLGRICINSLKSILLTKWPACGVCYLVNDQ